MDQKLKLLFEAAITEKKAPLLGAFLVNNKGEFLVKETFGRTKLDDDSSPPYTDENAMAMASCSKLITSIAALQLIEQGKLSPTDVVEQYVPEIAKIQVLESTTASDKPEVTLRPAKVKPTIHQLLTHTSGFAYDFFNTSVLNWRMTTGRAPAGYYTVGEMADFEEPYISEPGSKFLYGTSSDWLGLVIQRVTNMKFIDYVEKHVMKPIGMNKSGALVGSDRVDVYMSMNGNLVALPDSMWPENPEMPAGGGFLSSTLNDYAKLLSTILNQGTSPETGYQLLKPDTIKDFIFTDKLPSEVDKSELGRLGPGMPPLTCSAALLPTVPKSELGWSYGGLLLNGQDLPHGRKAGSGFWAGMMNLYYWIDPTSNMAGMVLSSMFPFFAPSILELFDQFERSAYGHALAAEGDLKDRNYEMEQTEP